MKILSTEHAGKIVASVENFNVIDCKTCGFKHIDPLLSEEEIRKIYQEQFYTKDKPDYLKHTEEDRNWWMLTYKNYYEMLEKYTKDRRLLDIGSGPGYFLECGKDRGWEVLGFEPSPQMAKRTRSRGLEVVQDLFNIKSAAKYGKFDVVSLNFVLEHIIDPTSLLRDVKKILSPGGLIFIVSPNDFNPLQEILWKSKGFAPWWIVPKHHINYFDFDSTKSLLKKVGFKTKYMTSTFPMEFFLLSGDNYVGNSEIGRASHKKRKEFETALYSSNPALLKDLYEINAAKNIGREYVIIGKLI